MLLVFVRLAHWVEYPKTKPISGTEVSKSKERITCAIEVCFSGPVTRLQRVRGQ